MARTNYFVNVWVTMRCNHVCRYCYVKESFEDAYMSIEVADKLIEYIKSNIKSNQTLIINFHGGEPTLNFDVVKYIQDKTKSEIPNKSKFGITTNGSTLDRPLLEYLTNNFDYNLSISIDGKRETQDYNRIATCKVNCFEELVNYAEEMAKINKNLRIRMTFDKENITKLSENIIYFIEKDFKNIVPVPDIYSEFSDNDFSRIEHEYRIVKEHLISRGISDVWVSRLEEDFQCLSKCSAGEAYFNVGINGDIFACSFLIGDNEHIIGSLDHGIDQSKLAELNKIKNCTIEACKDCELNEYCVSSRCLLMNYATRGNYFLPNLVECNMNNVKANIIMGE